jgi:hypothetical protein
MARAERSYISDSRIPEFVRSHRQNRAKPLWRRAVPHYFSGAKAALSLPHDRFEIGNLEFRANYYKRVLGSQTRSSALQFALPNS